jgi:hypothetical protein
MNKIFKIPSPEDERLKIPMGVKERREIVKQVAAISAFEGMYPTPDYEALRGRYASGEISASEMKALILENWRSRHGG